MDKNSKEPTPYEVARDYLQIRSNILLTISIIFLMIMPFVKYEIVKAIVIVLIVIVLITILLDSLKFNKNWVEKIKKKKNGF